MRKEYFTVSELAWELKRSRWYVYAMRRCGFRMPGGTATVDEAKEWLIAHPDFVARKVYKLPRREPGIRKI